jgi:hypothetical protein
MILESYYWDDISFYTFTYNDENLPIIYEGNIITDNQHAPRYWYRKGGYATLYKKDMQDFLKRLRFKIGKKAIKYYYCGEYGDKDGRPHYHAIIYGIKPRSHQQEIEEIWGKGFAQGKPFIKNRAQYTAGYIQKKLYGKEGDQGYIQTVYDKFGRATATVHVNNTAILAPFSCMSKGIGKQYILDHEEQLKREQVIRFDGRIIALPRYFIKQLNIQPWELLKKQELYGIYEYTKMEKYLAEHKAYQPKRVEIDEKKTVAKRESVQNSHKRLFGESRT